MSQEYKNVTVCHSVKYTFENKRKKKQMVLLNWYFKPT